MCNHDTPSYPKAVAKLAYLGEPTMDGHRPVWPDYQAMGITTEHVDDLIRLANDDYPEALVADEVDEVEAWWSGFHACCALGQGQGDSDHSGGYSAPPNAHRGPG